MKIATLFSGIGAPEKAFRMLGLSYDLEYFGEIDPHAVKSYCAIHNESESKNIGDITKVDIDKLPKDLDWLIGGSPCQDFSLAGKRAGGNIDSGTRSSLMWNFVEIIRETQPKQVLWENVQGALTADNKANYDKFINVLVAEGYKISAFTMNSKLYAIPQNRARIFVLASKSHTIRKPQGYDCGIRLKDVLESNVDEKYYLSDKQINAIKTSNFNTSAERIQDRNGYTSTLCARDYKDPKCVEVKENSLIELTQGQSQGYRVYDTNGLSVTLASEAGGLGAKTGLYLEPKLVGGVGEINFGKQYRQGNRIYDADEVACCLTAEPVGNTGGNSYLYKVNEQPNKKQQMCNSLIEQGKVKPYDVIRHSFSESRMKGEREIAEENNMSPTLDTRCDCLGVTEPNYRIRKLTPLECFRLMGFSDEDFYKAKSAKISNSQLYKQAGNSIVVQVLMAIFGEYYGIDWKPLVYGKWHKTGQEQFADLPIMEGV